MADNYVVIKIKADDTAKPDLTELKLDLDELGSKVSTAKVDVDDAEGKRELLDINAKLAALNSRVANPRIKVAGAAAAEAQITALEARMDALNNRPAELAAKAEAAEKAAADKEARETERAAAAAERAAEREAAAAERAAEREAAAAQKAADKQVSTLDRLKNAFTSLPSVSGGGGRGILGILGQLASNPYGLAALATGLSAALPELTGLVSGFAAAGAGAGAFGLLAMPAFKSVSGALTQIQADQKTYNRALTATAKNSALKHLKADYAALDPAQRGAVKGLQELSGTYHKMAKAFEPQAFKVFNDGLKIANNLLPTITPFANTFANALDGLLKHVGKFTQSKGFKDWLTQFEKLEGPSVTAIGNGIGKVAVAIGKLLTIMSKKDVVNAINIAFSVLSGTISAIGVTVKQVMKGWDLLTTVFDNVRTAAKAAGHGIASGFDVARHAAADLAHNVAAHFDEIRHATANLAHNIASYFDEARANIHRWADDVINFVRSRWKLLAAIILGPLGLAIDATATHLRGLETAFRVSFGVISAVVRVAVGVLTAILRPFAALLTPLFKGAWSAVVAVFSWAFGSMRSTASGGTSAIRGVLNWFSGLAGMFRRWFSATVSAVAGEIGRLIGFVRTIPGRVNSALGGLPSMLFRAGANAIRGLVSGMGSMVGSAVSMAAGWGHDIVNALGSAFGIHFSEPSEATKMIAAGKQIPRGLASGMLSGTGTLRSAAGTVSGAAYPHTGGGGGGGQVVIRIAPGAGGSGLDALFWTWLKAGVRVQGGDPAMFQRKVAYS